MAESDLPPDDPRAGYERSPEQAAREKAMEYVSALVMNLDQMIKEADQGHAAAQKAPDAWWVSDALEHAARDLRETRKRLFQDGYFGHAKTQQELF